MFENLPKYWAPIAAFLAGYGAIAVLFWRVNRLEKDRVTDKTEMLSAIEKSRTEQKTQIDGLKLSTERELTKIEADIKEVRVTTANKLEKQDVKLDNIKDGISFIKESLAELRGSQLR